MILNFIHEVSEKSNKGKDTIKTMCCLGVIHVIKKDPNTMAMTLKQGLSVKS